MTCCEHGGGCSADAVVAPKFCVPATGYEDVSRHLKTILGLKLCDVHFREFAKGFDFNAAGNGQLRDIFELMAKAVGPDAPPPDFSRAWVGRVSLTSSEYRMFEKVRNEAR